ncbi:MAG: MFS transporter [Clostridia bacterium]|nr:MFS transporter [Clostridia bacterium]
MSKKARRLAALLTVLYAASYATRVNFGAIVAEMTRATGFSKGALAWSLTGAFITYGLGQLVSGWLGDRFSPRSMLAAGFSATALMNLLMVFAKSPAVMAAIWCVNGFAQSFMWPPIVRLLVRNTSSEEYKEGVVLVSLGSSAGAILVYLVSPLLIILWGWRTVFAAGAVCGALSVPAVLIFCPDAEPLPEAAGDPREAAPRVRYTRLFSPVVVAVMAAIILQGALRDGVTTWMPSYVSETYSLGAAAAILTGVFLPLFSMICFRAGGTVYEKKIRDPMVCAGVFFAVGAAAAGVLFAVTGRSAVVSVIASVLLTGAMHGVNLILVCMLPEFFGGTGAVSFMTGALNTCTYVGSAASTYLFPLLTESAGWRTTTGAWLAVAAAGAAICFASVRAWKRRFGSR